MNAMTDDQIASERIKNASNLNHLENTISSQLGKLRNDDGFVVHRWLFELLQSIVAYLFELRHWQKLHDNRRG